MPASVPGSLPPSPPGVSLVADVFGHASAQHNEGGVERERFVACVCVRLFFMSGLSSRG